jgi:hypothetical protein
MNLKNRLALLKFIGNYIVSNSDEFEEIKQRAYEHNRWFTPEFINLTLENIANSMLSQDHLESYATKNNVPETPLNIKTVGIVMAGNIPVVGFHDFLCVFLSGHKQRIKLSSKDPYLLKHLVEKAAIEFPEIVDFIQFDEMLKGCDAYIATGTNNSARYFEYYFEKYPHIIRKNRTSIAILDGAETQEELDLLADDIQLYFGLGCRNVTQLYAPENYDFVPLLNALRKYDHYRDHAKYRHNFDYQLTIAIMNNQYYMSNDSVVMVKNESYFSPIGQIHYQFYQNKAELVEILNKDEIQCIVGEGFIPFGMAQRPNLEDYADGMNTMTFLQTL